MENIDFLVNPMREAVNVINKNGLIHIFGQDIHFSPLYIEHSNGESVVPLIELEGEVFFEKKSLQSRRRRDVFSAADLVFKSGEISTDESYVKFNDMSSNGSDAKDRANLNLSIENRGRLENSSVVQQVEFLIYDRVNGVNYAAEKKKLTLADLAGRYNPLIGKSSVNLLEEAAVRIYTQLERDGKIFVPRKKLDGKVDLGDILVNKKEDGRLELKLTDHPSLINAEDCAIDNSQSYAMVLSAFYESMLNRSKATKVSDLDVLKGLRNGITNRGFNHRFS